jgi:hypothetical protein
MPLRFGLFGRQYLLEESATGADLDTTSFGIEVATDPDVALVTTSDTRFSVFAGVAFGVGASEVETNLASNTWDTSVATFGLDAGLRLRVGVVTLALAYLRRAEAIDESDVEAGTFVRAVDTDFDGLAFTLGFVF